MTDTLINLEAADDSTEDEDPRIQWLDSIAESMATLSEASDTPAGPLPRSPAPPWTSGPTPGQNSWLTSKDGSASTTTCLSPPWATSCTH